MTSIPVRADNTLNFTALLVFHELLHPTLPPLVDFGFHLAPEFRVWPKPTVMKAEFHARARAKASAIVWSMHR
jgi:hypothetical protein